MWDVAEVGTKLPPPPVTLCLPWGRGGVGSPALTLTRAAPLGSQLFIQK